MRTAFIVTILMLGTLCALPSAAWQLDTHVGLTARAAQHSELDGWLRKLGFDGGMQALISLRSEALADHELLEELGTLDAALGATPDHGRETALDWLLAGAALEGVGIERLRNHFLDEHGHGLDERERLNAWRVRFDDVRAGLGTVRGAFTGVNFDGSGVAADKWIVSADNLLSRKTLLDAQADSQGAATSTERESALVRALVSAGAIAHVLEAMGDPAFVRNDFVDDQLIAGAPLARFASHRYGLVVPPASSAKPTNRRTLESFFHNPDGSGLADEIGRTYKSPATLSAPMTQAQLAATAEALLSRVGAETTSLLDFLFRGSLDIVRDEEGLVVQNGKVALGAGHVEVYVEDLEGRRSRLFEHDVSPVPPGEPVLRLRVGDEKKGRRLIALYRGTDDAHEPLVVAGTITP